MRSLFPRIFLSFWLAMTLIGAAFAIIYASTFPSERIERRRRLVHHTILLEAEHAMTRRDPAGTLRHYARQTDVAITVVSSDGMLGAEHGQEVASVARAARHSGRRELRVVDDAELLAIPFRSNGRDYIAVGRMRRPKPWAIAVGADTLPWRLLVVFLVSGLVSLLLARYLTRPLRRLRAATQRFADGDLSVRVTPELEHADTEIAALGREFDRMAARMEELMLDQQRLLTDVSHELNSPLARLRVALELARQRAGEGAAGPLDRIEREAERLSALIGEILTVARLEHGESRMEVVDLSALLEEIVHDADFEARSVERSVRVEHVDGDIVLTGDEEILRRAIENVVRNGVRFTAPKTEVTVRMEREVDEAVITIRDRGPGVPEHALRDIFLPLYRVERDRDRKTGGVGLGLAIAERAIKCHGGSVEAANVEEGLLVTIRIPIS
jgi:two-component system sensor histidine kinase CpxA